ncbi:hypothetical protein KFE94_06230 [bacterium SCSIO 12643]|nr:hypothetical protein KFE94_06230 [bacterium SCSIO 12643]
MNEDINKDISVTARMWQGQYEYLGIDIKINRFDSLAVKSISVKPKLENEEFHPWLDHYVMYSYYYEKEGNYKGGPYWKSYYADKFDLLPRGNRVTNKGNSLVKYTVHFNSKQKIDFDTFSADVLIELIDQKGGLIILDGQFEFAGERECYFSVH